MLSHFKLGHLFDLFYIYWNTFKKILGYGALGAVNAIGNEIRDQRQEGEIQRGRYELQEEKLKSAELEARLNQLERAQQMQQMQQMQQK